MANQLHAVLLSGRKIPLVGLGTWKSKPGQVKAAVKTAIAAGYRHIDCAAAYGNEREVGEALKEEIGTAVTREELFITSKLWNTKHRACDVRPTLLKTLSDLQLEYVDLYLVHWPMGFQPGEVNMPKNPDGTIAYDPDTHYLETWAAMEKLVDEGLVRDIGISNFNSKQVDEVHANSRIKPVALQCESHPYLTQKELIAHIAKNGIIFEAYSPLGSPDRPWAKPGDPCLLEDPKIVEIGKKYGKTSAQVLIRYQVERGVAVLPKSVTPERIRENFDVFDFKLSPEDMKALESFNRNWRACLPVAVEDGKEVARDRKHPHFPFHIPF